MATSRSQGISKVIIALNSINVPGLKFIAKTLKNDEFVQLGSSPRRPELMNILKTGDADVISFGSVIKVNSFEFSCFLGVYQRSTSVDLLLSQYPKSQRSLLVVFESVLWSILLDRLLMQSLLDLSQSL
jgi:hypothetical protein